MARISAIRLALKVISLTRSMISSLRFGVPSRTSGLMRTSMMSSASVL